MNLLILGWHFEKQLNSSFARFVCFFCSPLKRRKFCGMRSQKMNLAWILGLWWKTANKQTNAIWQSYHVHLSENRGKSVLPFFSSLAFLYSSVQSTVWKWVKAEIEMASRCHLVQHTTDVTQNALAIFGIWKMNRYPSMMQISQGCSCNPLDVPTLFLVYLHHQILTIRNWHSTRKWMVGILVSFWDGLFSGVMLVSGSVQEPTLLLACKVPLALNRC